MREKDELIEEILGLELEMFLTVPTDRQYSCQQDPEGFRLHRGVQFSIWSIDTLKSYRDDLRKAKKQGSNLMTVKYARMEDLIPRENFNPLLEKIVNIYILWQKEIMEAYPKLMSGARQLSSSGQSGEGISFETYLRAELETFSDSTLSLLYRDLAALLERKLNGSKLVYELLIKKLGYKSIEAAERAMV